MPYDQRWCPRCLALVRPEFTGKGFRLVRIGTHEPMPHFRDRRRWVAAHWSREWHRLLSDKRCRSIIDKAQIPIAYRNTVLRSDPKVVPSFVGIDGLLPVGFGCSEDGE